MPDPVDDWQPIAAPQPSLASPSPRPAAPADGGVDDWQPVGASATPALTGSSAGVDDWQPVGAPAAPQGPLTNSGNESWLSGAAKGLGTAAVRAGAMVAGMPGDLGNMLRMGEAAARKYRTGESYQDALAATNAAEDRNDASLKAATGIDASKLPDSQSVETGIENATGVGRYDPTTATGRIAQAGAAALLAGGVTPEATLEAAGGAGLKAIGAGIARDALPNAAAGMASQGTGELMDGQSPGTQAAWQLGAGLAGGMMGGAMRSAGRRFTPAGRDAAVGRDLLNSSSNPDAVKAALSGDAPAPLVAGSAPTTAELTGDGGLANLQDRAVSASPDAKLKFNQAEDQNNAARISALKSTAPDGADAMAPVTTFRDHLDAIQTAGQQVRDAMSDAHADAVQRLQDAYQSSADARTQAGVDFADQQRADLADRIADRQADLDDDTAAQARQKQSTRDALTQQFADRLQAAQNAAKDGNASLGARVAPDVAGGVLREHLQAAADQEKAATRALYGAVDPNGTLNAVATPLKASVRDIRAGIDPMAGVQPSGAEADLHQAIGSLPDVVPFRTLQTLDSRVTAAMADARRNPSASDPQALARLTQLKGATMDAINNSVEHQRAYEAQQVEAGALAPEDSINGRLNRYGTRLFGDADGSAGGSERLYGQASAAEARPLSGVPGTGDATGRGPTSDAGLSSLSDAPPYNPDRLSRPVPPSEPRPQSLQDFVKSQGGVRDVGGDLKAMGLDSVPGLVNNKPWGGVHPDKMREAAAEAGYLGADTDRAVQESTIGDLHDALGSERPVYSVHDEDLAARWAAHDDAMAHYRENRDVPVNKDAGPARVREQIPLSAYADELGSDRVEPGDPLRPNMTSDVADRLAAAKAQHQISAAYRSGLVGEALKSAGLADQYKLAPEAVARAATRDYSSAKAFLDKAKGAPEVAGHMGELLTNDLRSRVNPTGEVTPTALAAWETKNAGAIKALREVDPTYGAGFKTAAKANDALVQLGQERAMTLKAFETDAAGRAADAFTEGRKGLRDANTADKAATARTIADRRQADAQADVVAKMQRDAGIASSKASTGAMAKAADAIVAQSKKLPGAELAGKTDPSEVARFMGRLVEDKASGPTKARQFMASIANDDAAVAGARKALVDHVVGKLENGSVTSAGDRALSGPKLRTYVNDNAAALKAVMPKEHLDAWNAVAADMDRRDAARAAARTIGSPSASRLLPALKKAAAQAGHGGGHGIGEAAWVLALDGLMEHGLSAHGLALAAAPMALKGASKMAGNVLGREQRIRANLLTEALLNPNVARHYVRAVGHSNASAGAALVNTLRRGMTGLQVVR